VQNFTTSAGQAAITQLSGPFAAENTPADPTAIIPKMKKIDVKSGELNITLPPASYTIIRL